MGDLLIFLGYILIATVTSETKIMTAILRKIRARDRETLTSIYKEAYPMVEKYITNNSGTKADAQDVFQDSMYILIKKTANADFILTAKVSTFLFGISKNLWLKQITANKIDLEDLKRETEPNHETEVHFMNEQDFDQLKKVQRMKKCLTALGEPCKTILEHFYFLKTTMKRIAEILHYTNANNAKNQKYKCFVRLKKMVLNEVKNT